MKNNYFSTLSLDEIAIKVNTISNVPVASIWDFLKQAESLEPNWTRFEGWEDLDDSTIYRRLTHDVKPEGLLHVVTDASSSKILSGFEIDSCDIERLVTDHAAIFGECFFNIDTLIFSIEQKLAWILHHEGVFVVASEIFSER